MKANAVKFLQVLGHSPIQFEIPIYQRTYSWTQEQCQQLWDDIVSIAQQPHTPHHFIGSIVYIADEVSLATVNTYLVIDGQQRLTTLSLLLLAIGNYLEHNPSKSALTAQKIKKPYLVNAEESGDWYFKLLLTQSDRETLMRLIDGKPMISTPSKRVQENYQFFEKLISNSKVGIDEIFKGISKLMIVDVSLDRSQDNPQLIFESLNSTGLALSQADLIRNFCLMGLEPNEQTDLYQRYWYPMERSFRQEDYLELFDRFMRDYLTIKNNGKIPNINRVYAEFKAYYHAQQKPPMETILADVYKHSKHFTRLSSAVDPDKGIEVVFKDINVLKMDVAYPFLLEVMEDYEQKKFSRSDFVAILRLAESYVFRRAICGVPTNSMNKTFALLYKEVDWSKGVESLKAVLQLKDSYMRLPNDAEFLRELVIKDVYNFRSRSYLLYKLENFQRPVEMVETDSYTIEHIMPQDNPLPTAWQKELGPDYEQIQSKYVHTLGNLTLTGYNSEYSNHSFLEKRDYPDRKGFRNSPLFLNAYPATMDHWTEETIQSRASQLGEMAVKIWAATNLPPAVVDVYRKSTKNGGSEIFDLSHYEHLQGEFVDLYQALKSRIQNLDPTIKEVLTRYYISFKIDKNIVGIVPQKSRIRVTINIPFDRLNDPKNYCKDVTGRGYWGNGNALAGLKSHEQLDDIMALIKQAYEYQNQMEE